jgi:uncharacterized lipoprotein
MNTITMMKKIGILWLMITTIVLNGCGGKTGWFHDRLNDYENATTTQTLSLPANVKAESFSKEYEIPEV